MRSTSGLVLDVYDDFNGAVLTGLFPSREDLPVMVKSAHVISAEERKQLPDDAFALVLLNNGETLRKYACIDEGNTHLSVLYFLENAHKLPEEAQKVAAANLQVACGWYGLECEALTKVAGIASLALGEVAKHPYAAFQAAMLGPETVRHVRENNQTLSQMRAEEGGHRLISPDEIEQRKHAEMTGTALMPISAGATPGPATSKTVIRKVGGVGHLVQGAHAKHPAGEQGVPPATNEASKHKAQAPQAPQAHVLKPHVSVDGLEPPAPVSVKKASRYALEGRYPLDSFVQVKEASAYFEEFGRRLPPEARAEYCGQLLPRAEALSIKVSEDVRHYGAVTFGPEAQLQQAHDMRAALLPLGTERDMLRGLFEKSAALGPELFVLALGEFDQRAGLQYSYDRDLMDPHYSVLYKKADEEYSFVDGNNSITEDELRSLARVGSRAIKLTFGEDFSEEFRKDPVGIFRSLPRDQKHMLMNMGNDNSAPGVALRA